MRQQPDAFDRDSLPSDELAERATLLDMTSGYFKRAARKDNWFFLFETLPPHQARLVVAYTRGLDMPLLLDAFSTKERRQLKDRLYGAMHRIYLKGCSDPKWTAWSREYFHRLNFFLAMEAD